MEENPMARGERTENHPNRSGARDRYNAMRQLDHGVVRSAKAAMRTDSVPVNMYAHQYKKLNSEDTE